MDPAELRKRNFGSELVYATSRSSGPGGQNVNKVNTKVELRFSISATTLFTENEKEIIYTKLKTRINKDLELVLVAQEGRTQIQNKIIVTDRFFELISKAITLPEIRKRSIPTLNSKIKRLDTKRMRSNLKNLRKSGNQADEF